MTSQFALNPFVAIPGAHTFISLVRRTLYAQRAYFRKRASRRKHLGLTMRSRLLNECVADRVAMNVEMGQFIPGLSPAWSNYSSSCREFHSFDEAKNACDDFMAGFRAALSVVTSEMDGCDGRIVCGCESLDGQVFLCQAHQQMLQGWYYVPSAEEAVTE